MTDHIALHLRINTLVTGDEKKHQEGKNCLDEILMTEKNSVTNGGLILQPFFERSSKAKEILTKMDRLSAKDSIEKNTELPSI